MKSELYLGGKKYIPSRLAAERYGYTNDYIGQLCRGGKISSQLIARTWYVEEESLVAYRQDQQRLQAEANLEKSRKIKEISVIRDGKRDETFTLSFPKLFAGCAVFIVAFAFSNPSFANGIARVAEVIENSAPVAAMFGSTKKAATEGATLADTVVKNIKGIPTNTKRFVEFIFAPWLAKPTLLAEDKPGTIASGDDDVAILREEIALLRTAGVSVTSSIRPTIVERILPGERIIYERAAVSTKDATSFDQKLEQLENRLTTQILRAQDSILSSGISGGGPVFVHNAPNFSPVALSNRIDTLAGVRISDSTLQNVSLSGTITGITSAMLPSALLYADSSFSHSGSGTSSFAGALSTDILEVSGSATTTFTSGINLSSGCFAVNGTCVIAGGGGGTITGSGAAGQLTFWNGASSIGGSSEFIWDNTNFRLGVGSTTPGTRLGINGDAVIAGTTTVGALISTSTITARGLATSTFAGSLQAAGLNITGAASSTFANGLNLSAGCFSINGVCIGGGGAGTLTGTGVAGRVSFWDGVSSLNSDGTFLFDGAADLLTITNASSTRFTALSGITIGNTSTTTILGDGATSTFAGGVAGAGVSSSNGLTITAGSINATNIGATVGSTTATNLSVTNTSSSTFAGGVSTAGLSTSQGLTLTGGNILSTSNATSTLAGGFNITSGCFAVNNVCVTGSGSLVADNQLTSNVALLNRTGQIFTGDNTFNAAGTALTVTNTAAIGTLTITGSATSTAVGGILANGFDGRFGSFLQLNLGNGSATTTLTSNGATTTTTGGFAAAGVSSSNGISISGGTINQSNTATNTLSSISAAGIAASNGLTLTGGALLISSSATSTSNNGFNITTGCFAIAGVCSNSDGALSPNVALLNRSGQIFTGTNFFSALATFTAGASTTALTAVGSNAKFAIGNTSTTTILGDGATSTFAGGVAGAGLSSSNGVTVTAGSINATNIGAILGSTTATNLSVTNTSSSTLAGGVGAAGVSSSNGLTLTGGSILSSGALTITSVATSTFANGINTTAGCFAINGVCSNSDAALSPNVALLNRTGQIFTGDNTFNAAGTALTVTNTAAIGTLTITGSATSTAVGGLLSAAGFDSKFLTTQQILLGTGSATSSITGGATSTFSGGVAASGVSSSNGVTVTGGTILQTNTATNTLSSVSAAGLAASNGITLTGGAFLITSGATTTSNNGFLATSGCFATSLGCVGQAAGTIADAALTSNVALLNRAGQIFSAANTFSAAGTALTVTNTAAIGTLTVTGSATSTFVGGFITAAGFDSKFLTTQQILLGTGSATSSITGGATTTFSGGIAGAGVSSSNGVTVTGGIILQTNTATNTLSSISAAGLAASNGITLTGGALLITSSATTTSNNGFNITSGCFRSALGCVGQDAGTIADAALSSNVALLNRSGQIFTGTNTFSAAGTALTVTNTAAIGTLTITGSATSTAVGGFITAAGFDSKFLTTQQILLGTGSATSSITGGATSTFSGGVAASGVSSSNGISISGGTINQSNTATNTLSSISAAGLAASNGITLTGGNILSTSAATSTFANGINLSAGCFAINGVCSNSDAALSANVALLNRSSQTFTSTNSFTSAGTALTVTNTAAIGTLTITGSATSTSVGGFITAAGYDGKFATLQQILLGTGSATSSITSNGATTTFSGGVAGAGLSSSNGLTLTGGSILSSGAITITSAATSTFANGISLSAGCFATTLGCIGQAGGTVLDGALSANVALLNTAQTFSALKTFSAGASTTAVTALDRIVIGGTSSTTIFGNGATSTFAGGVAGAGISSSNGITISGGIITQSNTATNTLSSVSATGIAASNGITLTGGAFLITSGATTSSINGFSITAGCFQSALGCVGQSAGTIADAALSSNVALLNRAGQAFAGTNTFSAAGTALTVTNTAAIGTLTITASATSTSVGGILANGFDGRFGSFLQLNLGNGSATTTLTSNGATTTTSGGFAASGISSSNGISISGGTINQSNTATNTLSSISATGLAASNGLTLTGGSILSSGALTITSSATSTFANGINLPAGCFAINGVCSNSDAALSSNVALLNRTGQTFTGTNSFTSAGTALTVTNTAAIGTLTITGSATSTSVGGLLSAAGFDSKFLTTQQILLGTGSATSSITGGATSTFSGGVATAGISTSNGLTVTGGSLLATDIGATLGSTTLTNLIVTNLSASYFNGSVGVGTSSPRYALDVASTTRTGALVTQSVILSQSYGSIISAVVGSSTGYTNFTGGIGTGGTDSVGGPFNRALRITSTGNLVNIGSIQAGETLLTSGGTFGTNSDLTTAGAPYRAAVGDLDGDGFADIVAVNNATPSISVFRNLGNGTFASKVDYTTGTAPSDAAIGDLNGDGKADIAVANYTSDSVSIFINNGNGTFASKVDYTGGDGPNGIAIGDLNGDGKADVVETNYTNAAGGNSVSVLINNGNGTFASKVDYTTGTSPTAVAITDVNGDGKADMVTSNYGANTVSVLLNSGAGLFATKVDYATGVAPENIAAADFNNDGKSDFVVANASSLFASVFLNNGNGTFATKADYTTGLAPRGVTVGDFNGDGKQDFAVANEGPNTVSIFRNLGSGTFAAKVDYTVGANPDSLAVGDFNGDGRADIVSANNGASTVSVILNLATPILYASATNANVSVGTSTSAVLSSSLFAKLTAWAADSSLVGRVFNLIGSASTTLFTVTNTGDVGIGTSTPGSLLSVQGVANFRSGTSTVYGGVAAAGFTATSSGITITGGNLLISSSATSTSNNGFNITAGCFATTLGCIGQAAGTVLDGALSANVTLLNRSGQTFTETNTFSNNVTFGKELTVTSTATSTFVGAILAKGYDGKFATLQQILLGDGAATSSITGGATTTFSGGIAGAGVSTSNGLTLTGGSILSSGALTITSSATSTFANGISLSAGCFATTLGCIGQAAGTIGDAALSANVALLNTAQTFSALKTFSAGASTTAVTALDRIVIGGTSSTTIFGNGATSTFAGGVQTAGLASSNGITLSGGIINQSNTATNTLSSISASGIAASNGLTLTGGSILSSGALTITSVATSTFANGINTTAGCFAINGVCSNSDAALSPNVALLNRTGQIFTGTNTFSSAGTALTVTNTAAIGTLTITGSATSTAVGGFITATGYDGKYATLQQILLGSGSATSSITGGATSTFSGGVATAGLSSSNGLTVTGGQILSSVPLTVTSALSSTFAGNLGVGTTTPGAVLSVQGIGSTALLLISTSTTAASAVVAIDSVGFITLGPSNQFTFDSASGSTTIANLISGNTQFEPDAGIVTALDLPVVSALSGTIESYSFNLGASTTPNLTVYGESDGSAGIRNQRIGVGTTTPTATFSIQSNGISANTGFLFSNFNGAPKFVILDNGNVGIGTTTPGTALGVNGNAVITGTTTVGQITSTSTIIVAGTASSTFAGQISISNSSASSTFAGGVNTNGLASGKGITLTGGAFLISSGATSTSNNGFLISAGCFATSLGCIGQAAGTVLDAALSSNVALLNRTSQIFTGDNTFNAAGTALTVTNTAAIGTLTITGSATSTAVGGILANGFDGRFGSFLQLNLGNGSATTTLTSNGATTTTSGGFGASGLSSSNGLTLTGGSILSSGALTITSAATSTFANGISLSAGCFATTLGCIGQAAGTVLDAALSSNVALLNTAQTFSALKTFSAGASTTALTALDRIVIGGTSSTTIFGNGATSTFAGGVDAAGFASSNGITITGGDLVAGTTTLSGRLSLPQGTAAAPALWFSGNSTTGLYSSSGFNRLSVSVDGTVRAVFVSSGLQLMGGLTSASSPALSVDGSGGTTGIFSPAAATIAFSSGGTESARITSAGYLGIGTTSPGTILSVQGVANFTSGTSTIYGGVAAAGLTATSSGITITGGNLLISSGATSTSNNGFNLSAGCFAVNDVCISSGGGAVADNQLTSNVALLDRSGQTFTGTNIFSALATFTAGASTTALTALDRIVIGGTSSTTIFGNGATSTFAGGVQTAGLASSNGLTITGGSLLNSSSATSTFAGGLAASGFTTSGNVQAAVGSFSGNLGVGGFLTVQNQINIGGAWTQFQATEAGTSLEFKTAAGAGQIQFTVNGSGVVGNGMVIDSNGNVGIGTTSPGTLLSVQGVANFRSGTSTIYGGVAAAGLVATSSGITITGGNLLISSGATSTSNNGFNLSAGCFAVNDVCVGSGAGTITGGGTSGQLTFWSGATSIAGDLSFVWDNTNKFLGLGTSTPSGRLSVANGSNATTPAFIVSTSTASATSTAFIIDSNGRVGLGTTSPHRSAALAIDRSTGGGLGLPNYTTAERNNIATPLNGLMIYNSQNRLVEVWDGTTWVPTTATSGPAFYVTKGATQTFTPTAGTGAVSTTTWSTERFDTNSNFVACTTGCDSGAQANGENIFRPTVAGRYVITANINLQTGTNGIASYAAIVKNTTFVAYQYEGFYTILPFTLTAVVDMNGTTDYVGVRVGADLTGTTEVSSNSYFSGAMVGGPGGILREGWTDDGAIVRLDTNSDRVAIGTSTPYSGLTVWGQGATAATKAFEIANNASTTIVSVLNDGNFLYNPNNIAGLEFGIGTSTPWATLSVKGSAAQTNPLFAVASTTAGGAEQQAFVIDSTGKVGIGTTTPGSLFSVQGVANLTSATSTFYGGLSAVGLSSSNGLTLTGGKFAITSSATSTSNNGFNITAGCYAVNDTCSIIGTGTAGQVSFWSGTKAITGDLSFVWDNTTKFFGLGTSTPSARLSVANGSNATTPAFIISTSTASATSTVFLINAKGQAFIGGTGTNVGSTTINGFLEVLGTGTNATSTYASNLWVKGMIQTGTGSMFLTDTGLTSSDGNLVLLRNGTSSFNGGRVSIATSTPNAELDVNGVITTGGGRGVSIFDTIARPTLGFNAYASSYFAGRTGAQGLFQFDTTTGSLGYYNDATTNVGNVMSPLERITIDSNGDLGIGTTSPWGVLSVTNTGTGPSFIVEDSASPDTTPFIITAAGDVGIGTTTPGSLFSVQSIANFTTATSTFYSGLSAAGLASTRGVNLSGGTYSISGTPVLTSTTLGSGITGSSLTSVGTIATGVWSGTTVAVAKGGTGVTTSTGSGNVVLSASPTFTGTVLASALQTSGSIYFGLSGTTLTFNTLNNAASGFTVCMDGAYGIHYVVGDVCSASDSRLKHDIGYTLPDTLGALRLLKPATFVYNEDASSTPKTGFIAQDVASVIPDGVVLQPNGFYTLNPVAILSYAVAGIQQLASTTDAIRNLYASSTNPVIRIDESGNIAFGTTSPLTVWNEGVVTIGTSTTATSTHKLIVGGDVAATGFINVSTRASKKDITHLTQEDQDSILGAIRTTQVATYRYKDEVATSTLRLGLIAEEAPVEVLSADGKGVDLYKLTSFALAGVQAQQGQLDKMQLDLDALKAEVAAGGSSTGGGFSLAVFLEQIGAEIVSGILDFKSLMADQLTTKKLCIEDICVTKEEFKTLLEKNGITPVAPNAAASSTTTPAGGTDASSGETDTVAPTITINGQNPSTIEKGQSYGDLGVLVSDDQDLNPRLEVTGAEIDTTVAGEYTVTYTANDSAGNTSTATRIVNVVDPSAQEETEPEEAPADELESETASTTPAN